MPPRGVPTVNLHHVGQQIRSGLGHVVDREGCRRSCTMLCVLCLYVVQSLRTWHIGMHQKATEGQFEALLMSEKGRKKNPQREGLCREVLSPQNILLHAKRVRQNPVRTARPETP